MPSSAADNRPPVHLIAAEADTIMDLAYRMEDRHPQVSAMLIDEISRAQVHDAPHIPKDVVTMGSEVEFVDEASHTARTVTLVYPGEADIDMGRISVLTPIGAGLLGLRAGHSILWPDRDGHERNLTIVRVRQ